MADFWQQLAQGTYSEQNNQNAPGSVFALRAAEAAQKKKKDQPKGNFLTSLIPTAGGIGGALGGAALGSVVPGVGTAIGGLLGAVLGGGIGSGAGKVAENAVEGQKNVLQGVPQEAAMGALFSAPPIRAAKGILGAGKALAEGAGGAVAKQSLEEALTQPGMLAKAGNLLTGEARGIGIGERVGGSRIGPAQAKNLNSFVQNVIKPKGLTSAKQLEGVDNFISERGKQLTDAISQSNRSLSKSEKADLSKQLSTSFGDVINPSPSQQGIFNDIKTRISQAKDIKSLDDLRKLIDDHINFSRNSASPDTAAEQVYKKARGILTDAVANRVGKAGALKSDLSKAFEAQELMLNHAGRGGGIARANGTSIASVPIPARATQAAQSIAGKSLGILDKAPKTMMAGRVGLGTGLNINPSTLIDAPQDQTSTTDNTNPMTSMTMNAPSMVSNIGSSYQNSVEMSNPYPQANLLYDIQRDPTNADKYINYYQQLQSVFGSQEPKLNATQIAQSNNAQSALSDLNTIADAIQKDPNTIFKDAIPGGSLARGLTGTTDYDAAKQNVVDVIARLRSGAAISNDEAKRYMSLLPSPGDSQQSAIDKLQRLSSLLSSFAYPQSSSSSLEDVLTQLGAQ